MYVKNFQGNFINLAHAAGVYRLVGSVIVEFSGQTRGYVHDNQEFANDRRTDQTVIYEGDEETAQRVMDDIEEGLRKGDAFCDATRVI